MDNRLIHLSNELTAFEKQAAGLYSDYEEPLRDAEEKLSEGIQILEDLVGQFKKDEWSEPQTSLTGPWRELRLALSRYKRWLRQAL